MNVRGAIGGIGLLLVLGVAALGGRALAEESEAGPEKSVPDGPIVTLEQVLEIALKRNPQIDSSEWNVRVSRAQVTQAQSALMPQVSGVVEYQRGDTPVELEDMGPSQQFNSYTINFMGDQYVYGFGKVMGSIRERKAELAASGKDLDATVADVVRDARMAYYEVLKKQELVVVNREAVNTQAGHLEKARGFYDMGVRPRVDVTKGETDLAQARLGLIRAQYNLNLAVVDMERILGGPPVEGPYRLADVAVSVGTQGPLQPLIDAAMAGRPEVQSSREQIRAAKARHKAAWGEYWPSLHAIGQAGWMDTEFPLQDAWLVGASLTWDFFPGLRTVGEVQEAKAKVRVSEAQLRQQELAVTREVSRAYLLVSEAAESVATSEIALKYARENMELVQGRYEAGLTDAITFNDAVLDLTSARSDVVQYRYGYMQAEADLIRAVGMPYAD